MSPTKNRDTTTTLRTVVSRGSTPRSQIKSIHWRGDVISVVNRYFEPLDYELIPFEPADGQECRDHWYKVQRTHS